MRRLRTVVCLASLLLLSTAASAQQDIIHTFAGGGPNNVPATSANVPYPVSVATDSSGNYYFTTGLQQNRVFKVNTSGTLTVFAGDGFAGYSGDGWPAVQAELNNPWGIAADSFGNVYIADNLNCIIRKVDKTGSISTFAGTPPVAGTPQCSYGGDGGKATSAYLNRPYGVAVDSSGNVYIADTDNYRIREVAISDGHINTVAGDGTECAKGGASCGDGGLATSAGITGVTSLAVDGSGYVYIADYDNDAVREFTVGGDINTVAGGGSGCAGQTDSVGDGCSATSAELSGPYGVAVDSYRNIFISDVGDYRIREVTVSNGKINTVAGNGTECTSGGAACGDSGAATDAKLSFVYGVAVDSSDDIFIADYYNLAIREVTDSPANTNPVSGNINTVAGNGTLYFIGNGVPATAAVMKLPTAATSDSNGNIYIADSGNCIVREVNAATGNIQTIAGTPGSCGYGGDGSAATSAQLNEPTGVAVYGSDVYIADSANCVIREVNSSGEISTFAGTPGVCKYGGDNETATSAYLNNPTGLAVDVSGDVYIADTDNNVIREVSGGTITTVAGGGSGCAGQTDSLGDGCTATSAELNAPQGVALDTSGNLYIADSADWAIRMVNTAGIISTFAGNGYLGITRDGVLATESGVDYPAGVTVDVAGDVLIAEAGDNRIRWVDGRDVIHTVAGDGTYGFIGDGGLALSAMLANPYGVGLDPSGNIYVADTYNDRVRMVSAVAGLNASTTSVTFVSPQTVGMTSSPQKVTLSAVGPLDISNIVLTGDFSQTGDCTTGSMSGQCVMNITFTPTAVGTRAGQVTITDNGFFGTSLVINLQGTGLAVTASLSPTTLVFAAQDGGTTSAAKTLTLTNSAKSAALSISGTSFSGANPNDFAIAPSSTCGSSLAASSSCTYNITFTPSMNGAESATFSVNDSEGTQTATLKGTGIGAVLAPAKVAFEALGGTTTAPKTLTLTNYLSSSLSLSAAISGTNMTDFAIAPSSTCGSSLAGNSSCTYMITFTPSLNGAESATLSVSDADGTQTATLNGTGIGAVLAPTTLAFAAQDGRTTSAAKTLTLTNYLPSSLGLSPSFTGANPTDFAIAHTSTCGSSLAGNSNCTYNITFRPTANGAESATFSVSDADGTQTATLKGTGIGATLSPTTLTFAAQDGGTTSAAKTLTLTNYLSSSLSPTPSFSGANPADFAIAPTSTCGSSLPGNSNCTYNITFTPSLNGAESATFNVVDADGTQTATLKGTGIGATLAPTTLTFAARNGGTISAAQTLTLTNYLSSSLSLSPSFTGANPTDFAIALSSTCGSSLAGNSNCTYNITFRPTANGAESATLGVSDADGTQTATLKGTGIGAVLAPAKVAFAALGGTTTAPKTLTLTNYLSSSLSLSAAISGTNASDFAIAPTSTCGSSLAGNSSCTYMITFKPSLNGAESATLSVSDADGTQTAELLGTGIGAALSPTSLTFPAQTKGTTSAAKTITLTNYLSTALTISGASFSGTNFGDFAIAPSSTCGSSLAGNSSCTYNITFTPSTTSGESATLSVSDADGTQTAKVSGTGK